mgnify:CR=1 FL=1
MILGFFIGGIFLVIGLIEPAMNRKGSKSSSDRYCPDCGREIPFNALFCPYYGRKFESMNGEHQIDEYLLNLNCE